MELKPEQLAAQVGTGPLKPAYLVAGPETLRVLEAADAVRVAARAQGITEREVFDTEGSREPDWAGLSATLGAPSLFASRRLIEVRLPTGKPGKEGAALLAQVANDPPPDITLLVTAHDWSRQHGGAWSEAIGRAGVIAVAWQVKPHELGDWVDRRLRQRGVRAEPDAVARLVERVDGNLLAAAQEIDKLALLADGTALDAARMESLVADSARFDVFRVIDAAMNGQGAQAARMLASLRAEGEAVPALLGMVVMQLQRGATLARAQARGANLANEFKALRIWDTQQPMYRRALARHAPARWDALLVQAGRADRMAKGREQGDAWVALERLLLALAEKDAAALLAR